nr:hypothetical protein [Tanacetum cinerariifolium]
MNFGCIHGGDNPNRICGQCSLEFDLRPLPGMDPEMLRAAIRQKLQPLAELHQVKIDYAPLFSEVAPFEQSADAELVRVAERLTGHTAIWDRSALSSAPWLRNDRVGPRRHRLCAPAGRISRNVTFAAYSASIASVDRTLLPDSFVSRPQPRGENACCDACSDDKAHAVVSAFTLRPSFTGSFGYARLRQLAPPRVSLHQ